MPANNQPSLAFRAFGPENAPAIVFLHGGGSSGWMWEPVIASLPGYRCLVPDLPQHGASQQVKPFTMSGAAQAAAELIRSQTGAEKAHVVGLSEGAQVAVALLAQSPGCVDRAVISSALLRPIPGTGWLTRGLLAWTYRLTMAPLKNSDWWIGLNRKYSAGVPQQYHAQFRADFQSMTEDGFANLMAENLAFRLPPGLEKVYAPALVIAGKKEYSAMRRSARDLASALPNARAVLLNLGSQASLAQEHNWALTAPDLFAQTVRAWIEDLPLPNELEEMSE